MQSQVIAERPTNRLSRQKSPYLLQHQHNPVDWQPWEEAAFAQARREDKPIFLSIGYSTCHWCHVMERESFERDEIAEFLNRHFVSIKVDREERPDVDKIYMTFVQATSGQGGWPLNVFLTPDRKPFFGGTYFPPDSRHGRAGFLQVLQQIQKLWETRKQDIAGSAGEMHDRMQQLGRTTESVTHLTPELLRAAGLLFKSAYDSRHGGFGGAPKFPQPSQPLFLLRYGKRFGDDEAVQMVLHTCNRMAAGGIRDQLGGGFSRYSVDAEWLVPHFEKMLYDNAQLVQLYLDAYLVSGEVRHAEVARDVLAYVLRDMTHPEGAFYSAEDADSEGHEGKFYCWTRREMAELLTPGEFEAATRYFGVTEQGNFVDHSHPEPLSNQNVLSIVHPDLSPAETGLVQSAKRKLLEERSRRVRPHLDDKVLASWNGLMVGAFARSFGVLGDAAYLRAAERGVAFLKQNLWEPETRTLHHRWREGERDGVQLLQGYAFLLSGLLDLYEVTLNPGHLEFSISLAETMLDRFYDPQNGGFWQSPATACDLILRLKEDYDGAEPSGNSVAVLSLLRLGKITSRPEFTSAAESTLRGCGHRLEQLPQALPSMLQALDFFSEEPRRAVVTGPPGPKAEPLAHAIHSVYQPNKVVLGTAGPVEPFAKTLPTGNTPLVYFCTGTACQPPTDDLKTIRALVRG
jgi:uncharacterized protein